MGSANYEKRVRDRNDPAYWRKREYMREYMRQYYKDKKPARDRIKRKIAAIKMERGCVDCGYNQHPHALHFDHRDPADKRFALSTAVARGTYPWSTILEEINKCDVRCANCHAIRTATQIADGVFTDTPSPPPPPASPGDTEQMTLPLGRNTPKGTPALP